MTMPALLTTMDTMRLAISRHGCGGGNTKYVKYAQFDATVSPSTCMMT